MSREMLFKAKVKNTDKWVKGYYIHHLNRTIYPEKREEEQHIIVHDGFGFRNGRLRDTEHHYIDPSTLCQYTGLTDKSGKEIWENDILMCHGNPKDLAKAVFGEFDVIDVESEEVVDSVIGWHYEVIPTDELSKCKPFCYPMPLTEDYIDRCEMKVIGNAFDNPKKGVAADD